MHNSPDGRTAPPPGETGVRRRGVPTGLRLLSLQIAAAHASRKADPAGLPSTRPAITHTLTSAISDSTHGSGLARLGSKVSGGVALTSAARGGLAWLSHGVRLVGHRDEEWLKRGLTSSR